MPMIRTFRCPILKVSPWPRTAAREMLGYALGSGRKERRRLDQGGVERRPDQQKHRAEDERPRAEQRPPDAAATLRLWPEARRGRGPCHPQSAIPESSAPSHSDDLAMFRGACIFAPSL
jgi:hypothetical protein